MAAKPPRSVTVGGVKIPVKIDPEMEAWGSYDGDAPLITLSSKVLKSHKLMFDTLRHEMTHAAFHVSGIAYLKRFDEEAVVRCVETILLPALDRLK